MADPDPGPLEVHDLTARCVTENVVIVTYRTTAPARVVRRSSWWVGWASGWQIVFHQGTPTTPT
jgi:hypothetical protein